MKEVYDSTHQPPKPVSQGWPGRTIKRYRDPEAYREHLLSCTERIGDCLLFTGYISSGGYAMITYQGKHHLAHYILWEMKYGKRPNGMHLDHICHDPKMCKLGRNCPHRRCINIDHLKIGTPKDNSAPSRSNGSASIGIALKAAIALKKSRTHCPHGHEWTPENTILALRPDGSIRQRVCRSCSRKHKAKHKKKVRDAQKRLRLSRIHD